jgi:hypothetical protein
MNTTPVQPDSNERKELARLLPEPVERDLPSDRHRQIQEFVMSHIHQDLQAAEQAPRHSPKRRLVLLASAVAAVAAVVIGTGGFGSSGGGSVPAAAPALSGQQILLAAATVAERTPEGSGTYWHVKVGSASSKNDKPMEEFWTQRDGQTWVRGWRSNRDDVVKMPYPIPFALGGPKVSFEQLETLPTTPDELKAWIADVVKHTDFKKSTGPLDAKMQERVVFDGLISLISQLPAPPKVRAAAFQAIASYPNVKSLGAVKGGQGLEISFDGRMPAQLVIDPATSQIRETNFFVSAIGPETYSDPRSGADSKVTLLAEWTNELPK